MNRLGIVVPGGSVEAASASGQGCACELRLMTPPQARSGGRPLPEAAVLIRVQSRPEVGWH